jgi:hypothetical protein
MRWSFDIINGHEILTLTLHWVKQMVQHIEARVKLNLLRILKCQSLDGL